MVDFYFTNFETRIIYIAFKIHILVVEWNTLL